MANKRLSTYLLSSYTPTNISAKKSVLKSCSSEMHFHDCIEFELVIGGSGYQILNGNRHNISKGSLTLLGPLDYHEVGAGGTDLELFTLMFRPHLISQEYVNYFSTPHDCSILLDGDTYELILSLFTAIAAAYKCKSEDDVISDLVNCIIRAAATNRGLENEIRKHEGRFQEIISYVNLHFRESPTIGDIAALFHYNKNYICNLFEKQLGVTYKDYLTGLNVEYAERMLKTTDLPVSRICFECGFGSFSAINRAFRKYLKKTPTEIRKA